MELVSSQSEPEHRAAFAKRRCDGALRRLTANLMRVARGAGRAYEIPAQIHACAVAMQEYREAVGFGLSDQELADMLRVRKDLYGKDCSSAELERADGIEMMLRGALQIAASRLLDQRTQERAGEGELLDGARAMERSREERRREMQADLSPTSIRGQRAAISRMMSQSLVLPSGPPDAPQAPDQPAKATKATKATKRRGSHKDVLAAYKAERGIK